MSNSIINTSYYEKQPRPLVAVDYIIFGFDDGQLKLLLFKRKVAPFKDEWSLIGSFVQLEESVNHAASRVLAAYTGLKDVFLEELSCYGQPQRDPGGRVITMAHYALIRVNQQNDKLTAAYQAQWFDLNELPNLILDHRAIRLRRAASEETICSVKKET